MKQQIEETLQCLIGNSLWGAGRVANLLTFQFGSRQLRTNYHGKLHYEPDDEHEKMSHYEGEPYSWSETETRLLDERLYSFFRQCEKTPILVQAVRADELGGLTLVLSDNHTLTVFPDDSLGEEYWRFFEIGKDLPHFVVTGQGIEDPDA